MLDYNGSAKESPLVLDNLFPHSIVYLFTLFRLAIKNIFPTLQKKTFASRMLISFLNRKKLLWKGIKTFSMNKFR